MKKLTFITRLIKLKKTNLVTVLTLMLFLSYISTRSYRRHETSLSKQNTSSSATALFTSKDEERYLAYLPHSGLSNQRIELANALLLAHMLKRTLIIPPAFLGTVFGWMKREQLTDRLEWLTTPKNFPQICQRPTPGRLRSYVQRSRCSEYRHFGILPWTELHDFSSLEQSGIRIKFQSIVSLDQLKRDLKIENDDEVYLHHDMQLYDWRLYQNQTEAIALLQNRLNYFDSFAGRRYYKILLPHHFERRKEKLLYLGGIFGSTRINLIEPEDRRMQEKIRQALHYRLDTSIGQTVQAIVHYLGGKGSFMGLHFRTGDNPFRKEIPDNLMNFMKNMTDLVSQESLVGTEEDTCLNLLTNRNDHILIEGKEDNQQQQYQFSTSHSFFSRVKVYLATDYRDPRGKSSQLLPWFDSYPCTTILSDLPDYLFSPLDNLRDIVVTSKSLRNFLIPLVDAMVVAHGKTVLTTPRSTFSKYIEELHYDWLE
ncbi:MAG: hypothetical protein EXX96DRAFT_551515 [Benjaminiella poitrasii]|nr:MAG: hypothetical protein EXX96DRAFT_551515 [Benjaminiella poitrasii]